MAAHFPDNQDHSTGGASPRYRVDSAELAPPQPHAFALPERSDIQRLARWLDQEDLTINEFGQKLSRYPGLSRYVIAVANHSVTRGEGLIREPVHAAAFLGIARLQHVLQPLANE